MTFVRAKLMSQIPCHFCLTPLYPSRISRHLGSTHWELGPSGNQQYTNHTGVSDALLKPTHYLSFEELSDEVPGVGRQVGRQVELPLEDLLDGLLAVLGGEGRRPRQHVVHQRPQRPPVHRLAVPRAKLQEGNAIETFQLEYY